MRRAVGKVLREQSKRSGDAAALGLPEPEIDDVVPDDKHLEPEGFIDGGDQ